jgi:DNA-binding CsgD family transcriptional regulator
MKRTVTTEGILTGRESNDLLDLIYRCIVCETQEDLSGLLRDIGNLFSYDYATCVYGGMEGAGIKVPYHTLNINFPDEWVNLYVERKYHLDDPIFKKHFQDFAVQYWEDTYRRNSVPKEFLKLSTDFKLDKGYTHGARNLKGTRGSLISFSGSGLCKEVRTEVIIEMVVPHLHQAIEKVIQSQKVRNYKKLSTRETETLKWLVQGKTAWEISVIMGISERTVRYFIHSITEKLDAVSSIHAAAIGLDLGLVNLD